MLILPTYSYKYNTSIPAITASMFRNNIYVKYYDDTLNLDFKGLPSNFLENSRIYKRIIR